MGSFCARADFSLFFHQRGRSLVVPGYKLSWSNGAALSCETPPNKLKLTIVISSLLLAWFLLIKKTKMKKKSDNIAIQLLCHHMWAQSYFFKKTILCKSHYLVPFFHAKKAPVELGIFVDALLAWKRKKKSAQIFPKFQSIFILVMLSHRWQKKDSMSK